LVLHLARLEAWACRSTGYQHSAIGHYLDSDLMIRRNMAEAIRFSLDAFVPSSRPQLPSTCVNQSHYQQTRNELTSTSALYLSVPTISNDTPNERNTPRLSRDLYLITCALSFSFTPAIIVFGMSLTTLHKWRTAFELPFYLNRRDWHHLINRSGADLQTMFNNSNLRILPSDTLRSACALRLDRIATPASWATSPHVELI
jgi:hypothetical protein